MGHRIWHHRAEWSSVSRAAGTLAALVVTFLAGGAAPALASGWSIQATPTLNGPPQGVLDSVSCTAADCVGVGNYVSPAGTQVPLVERWNGSAWTMQTTPAPPGGGVLYGVSCAPTSCTAVGYEFDGSGVQVTLAEQWTATTGWVIEPAATLSGATKSVLSGVSCTAASACTAVGYYINASGTGQTLGEAWNGSSWSVESTATPSAGGDLARVSCSAANACTALGQASGTTLVYRWNGKKWSSQTIAVPTGATSTGLYAVTCTGSTLCTAVGHWSERRCNNGQPTCNCFKYPYCTLKQGTLVERWNGTAWAVESAPSAGGTLYDVSCTSVCTAVGTNGGNGTLAEQSNGSSWTVQTTPTPAGGGIFQSVSCTAATACEAVGQGNGATLGEDWTGTSWAIQPTPNPPGPASSGFSGVSCPITSACTAVGSYTNSSGAQVTLAEQWDGTNWTVPPQSPLNPAGAASSGLATVSCAAATSCTAAGAYATPVGGNPPPDFALAHAWSNGSWTIQTTQSPGTGYNSVLSGLSCTAGTPCMSVGYDYFNQGPQDAPLAEQWTGGAWTIRPAAVPAGAYSSALSSVSCPTATDCIAVGSTGIGSPPLAEHWNGTSWTLQTTAGLGSLASVSCTAANFCMAVGSSGGAMLAETRNGTAWTLLTPVIPSNSDGSYLSGVSCLTATDCTAVGYYTITKGPDVTLAEHWDGTAWTIETTPNPPGAVDSYLSSVSCSAATACDAVGHYQNQANANEALAERYSG